MINIQRSAVVVLAGALFALAGCNMTDPLLDESKGGEGGHCETSMPADLAAAGKASTDAARKELESAAASLGVDVLSDLMSYVVVEGAMLVHAPVAGYEKYTDEDFAKGVPLTVLLTRADGKFGVPDGNYLVKVQVGSINGALHTTGKATFLDSNGKVVVSRPLYVRYPKELNAILPEFSDENPANIPRVTSTHILRWDKVLKQYRYWVDCTGWDSGLTLFF